MSERPVLVYKKNQSMGMSEMQQRRFAPKDQGYPGSSRDWMGIDIPCQVTKCPANNGMGKCIMSSCIKIGADGKCELASKHGGIK